MMSAAPTKSDLMEICSFIETNGWCHQSDQLLEDFIAADGVSDSQASILSRIDAARPKQSLAMISLLFRSGYPPLALASLLSERLTEKLDASDIEFLKDSCFDGASPVPPEFLPDLIQRPYLSYKQAILKALSISQYRSQADPEKTAFFMTALLCIHGLDDHNRALLVILLSRMDVLLPPALKRLAEQYLTRYTALILEAEKRGDEILADPLFYGHETGEIHPIPSVNKQAQTPSASLVQKDFQRIDPASIKSSAKERERSSPQKHPPEGPVFPEKNQIGNNVKALQTAEKSLMRKNFVQTFPASQLASLSRQGGSPLTAGAHLIRSLLDRLPGKPRQTTAGKVFPSSFMDNKIHNQQTLVPQKHHSSFFITFSKDIHDFLLHHSPQTNPNNYQKIKPRIILPFRPYWILGGMLVALLSALFFFRPTPAIQDSPRNPVLRTATVLPIPVDNEITASENNSVRKWTVLPSDTIWGYFQELTSSTDPADRILAAGGWENFQNLIRANNPALTDLNMILLGDTIIISSPVF